MSEVSEEFRNKRLHFDFALGDRAAASSGRIERDPRVAVGRLGVTLDGVHRRWPCRKSEVETENVSLRDGVAKNCVVAHAQLGRLINDVEVQHSTRPFLLSDTRSRCAPLLPTMARVPSVGQI